MVYVKVNTLSFAIFRDVSVLFTLRECYGETPLDDGNFVLVMANSLAMVLIAVQLARKTFLKEQYNWLILCDLSVSDNAVFSGGRGQLINY